MTATRRRDLQTYLFLISFSTIPAVQSEAQVAPAKSAPVLHGTVLDQSLLAVDKANITALCLNSKTRPAATSNSQGRFSLALEPGSCTVEIEKPGFASQRERLTTEADSVLTRQFVLKVALAQSTVVVNETRGYLSAETRTAIKTPALLRDLPQSITIIGQTQIADQMMLSIGDVVRYVPGVTAIQGENNRDQLVIRGNSTSADFYLDGVRDDVQYYRDLYNIESVEVLKGPNAMEFGRGGGGGIVNRVTKEAVAAPIRSVTVEGGQFGQARGAMDLDVPLNAQWAFRTNAFYEHAGSFRDFVDMNRYGLNPTATFRPDEKTRIVIGYENLHDRRVADRGIPSFQGRPLDTPVSTYFGNPDQSRVLALANIGSVLIERQLGEWSFHNRTLVGDYDRGYQNFVPGVVSADKTLDTLTAYNNATQRRNLFNQTDLSRTFDTGQIRHTLVAGVEAGHQATNNFRNTGYFDNTSTSIQIPLGASRIDTPTTFRQSATDADNHLTADVGAVYVQDQVRWSKYFQAIGGVRFDRFDLRYFNNRTGVGLDRVDKLISPRVGVVVKPVETVSFYANYSVSFLPSSGDQFSSLTTITQQVKPERFTNYEGGAKWDVKQSLGFTLAAYQLDRTNTRATDPNDSTRIVQTGSQRTNGVEVGLSGSITRKWKLSAGYANQNAFVTSATTAAVPGAQVGQVPHHTFLIWNFYQLVPRVGVGAGILNRSDMFAAIDDTVRLPGYARVDTAVYFSLTENVRLQANMENLGNAKYILNADNNTNISPGSPRAVRIGLTAHF